MSLYPNNRMAQRVTPVRVSVCLTGHL